MALGIVSRRYAQRIPFIVKLNHNEFLNYPNTYDQVMFGSARQAADLGAVGVGATIYFGSEEPTARSTRCRRRSPRPTGSGMFTVLVVLPAQPGLQDRTGSTTTCPPTSPGRPTTSG